MQPGPNEWNTTWTKDFQEGPAGHYGTLRVPSRDVPLERGKLRDFAGHFPLMSRKPEVESFEYNRGGYSEGPHQPWTKTDR